jgi:hypothetical protein
MLENCCNGFRMCESKEKQTDGNMYIGTGKVLQGQWSTQLRQLLRNLGTSEDTSSVTLNLQLGQTYISVPTFSLHLINRQGKYIYIRNVIILPFWKWAMNDSCSTQDTLVPPPRKHNSISFTSDLMFIKPVVTSLSRFM